MSAVFVFVNHSRPVSVHFIVDLSVLYDRRPSDNAERVVYDNWIIAE